MNIKNPKITVLMPVYNGERYLKEAIESILNQSFSDFEFLIINDGSTDKSEEIIKFYKDGRIVFVNNSRNKGLIYTLNKGLRLAKGEYIARMDQDDISLPKRLEIQINFMNENPKIALLGSSANVIEDGKFIPNQINFFLKPELIKFNLIFFNTFVHSVVFFRKEIIQKMGGYDARYKHAEDFDLWFRVSRENKVINLGESLINYRIHNSSIIHSDETQKITYATVKKIIFKNCKHYINISEKEFTILFNAIADKRQYRVENFLNLIIVFKIYTRLFYNYIKKEKLNIKQIKEITPLFLKNIFMFFRWYLKYNFSFFYDILKKLKSC